MNKNQFKVSKTILLSLVAVLTLSACGQSLEAPELVMGKAKEVLVEVQSAKVAIDVSMKGDSEEQDLTLDGDISFAFDAMDEANKKLDLAVKANGNMQAGEQSLDGEIDFGFITLDKEYYISLNKLETSDQTLDQMKPFLNMYMNKWLRIAEDFIPEDIRDLQGQDEEMKMKQTQLEELFVSTELFTVSKEYAVESLNGRDVYHYGLAVNRDGFRDYIQQAAIIDGRELTNQELDEAIQILDYLEGAELYIDTKDYYILKAIFKFSGEAIADEAGANLTLEVTVEASDYNEDIDITAPADAEDFNPLNLLMGLGGAPTMEMPTEEMMMDELMMDELVTDDSVNDIVD